LEVGPHCGCKIDGCAGIVGTVRLTDFWERLDQAFGRGYATSVARDQVLTQLGGRTINQALDAGVETVVVWRAVCAAYPDRVPAKLR
jgi:hypothetical protein